MYARVYNSHDWLITAQPASYTEDQLSWQYTSILLGKYRFVLPTIHACGDSFLWVAKQEVDKANDGIHCRMHVVRIRHSVSAKWHGTSKLMWSLPTPLKPSPVATLVLAVLQPTTLPKLQEMASLVLKQRWLAPRVWGIMKSCTGGTTKRVVVCINVVISLQWCYNINEK